MVVLASRLELFLYAVIFIAVFSAVFFLSLPAKDSVKKYAFEAVEEGIVFHSDEMQPRDFLLKFRDFNSFYIVISEKPGGDVSASGNSLVAFQAVLTASGKKAISVVKELGSKGNVLACYSNKGIAELNVRLSASECSKMLSAKPAGFIIIESSDTGLKISEIVLEKNSAFLKPRVDSDLKKMSLLVLKAMFADSEEKIKLINNYWQNASSGKK